MSTHLYPEVAAHVMRVTHTAHWLEWQDWADPILQDPYEVKDGRLHIPLAVLGVTVNPPDSFPKTGPAKPGFYERSPLGGKDSQFDQALFGDAALSDFPVEGGLRIRFDRVTVADQVAEDSRPALTAQPAACEVGFPQGSQQAEKIPNPWH